MKAANEVISTGNPAAVTFDTLTAAKELRKTGLDDRQSEAIVATISKAMSETVATKADLELQGATTRADIEALRAATKADLELQGAATKAEFQVVRAEMKAGFQDVRAEMKAEFQDVRAEMKTEFQDVRAEMKLLAQSVDNRFEKMDLRFKALEQSIIIKLGALMVTMAFLLLAIGPFYIRWVLSMMGAG